MGGGGDAPPLKKAGGGGGGHLPPLPPPLPSYAYDSDGVSISYIRREALSRWKRKQGLAATYGNLLELFVKAGHTQCAEALCKVLREKCEWNSSYSCSNCC